MQDFIGQLSRWGLGRIDVAEHFQQVVLVLFLGGGKFPSDNLPAFHNVDAVVPVVAVKAGANINSEGEFPTEVVADHLAEAGPAVTVLFRRAVAFCLAVEEKSLNRVAASVPVQVDADSIGICEVFFRGDDSAVSHL